MKGGINRYSRETIAAAIEASKTGEKQLFVAMRFGIDESTLRRWRRLAGISLPTGRPRNASRRGRAPGGTFSALLQEAPR